MVAKSPDDRFQTADEVVTEMASLGCDGSTSAAALSQTTSTFNSESLNGISPDQTTGLGKDANNQASVPTRGGRRVLILLALVAVIGLSAVLTWRFWRGPPDR